MYAGGFETLKRPGSPGAGITGRCEPLAVAAGLNAGPLEEQYRFSTAEPSIWPGLDLFLILLKSISLWGWAGTGPWTCVGACGHTQVGFLIVPCLF